MIEKISVNVKILPLNTEHNFLVPVKMSVKDATELILQALHEEYPNVPQKSAAQTLLVVASSGMALGASLSFEQLGIIQGEKLLLI